MGFGSGVPNFVALWAVRHFQHNNTCGAAIGEWGESARRCRCPQPSFLHHPCKSSGKAGLSPIPLTISQFRTAGSGRRACNGVCPEIWSPRPNMSAATGSNMMFEADVNQLPANKLGQGQTARPYPQFSGIGVGSGGSRTGSYNGVSNYEAVQFMLHKPTSHGLAAELAYTWSRLYDDMDDSGWGNSSAPCTIRTLIIPRPTMGPRISTGQTPEGVGDLCGAARERTPILQFDFSRCGAGRLASIKWLPGRIGSSVYGDYE